jgi:putative FmdB family regulatory protein
MPTYEYVCEKCGHQFEKFQSMADKPLAVCPKELCGQKRWGKGRVKKLISSGAGLIFKGSGFYITDYRSEKYKEAAKKDAPATTSTSDSKSADAKTSKPASGGESKPAAKTESKPAKPAKSGD